MDTVRSSQLASCRCQNG